MFYIDAYETLISNKKNYLKKKKKNMYETL